MNIPQRIADELACKVSQVEAAVTLLDEGATVPFISRYRKEATGGLDDTQMRTLEERLGYLRELEERRATVLKSIDEQGKLTQELRQSILDADTKTRLEDLYRPYMQKRRTKAQIAREAGLEPLALALLGDPRLNPEEAATPYICADKGVADAAAALEGARQILMEIFAEDAELIGRLRDYLWENALIKSTVVDGKQEEGATSMDGLMPRRTGSPGAAKFSDYFEHREPLKDAPSHRALALFRGRNEGVLALELIIPADEVEGRKPTDASICEGMIAKHFSIANQNRPADKWLRETVRWAWRVKIFSHLDIDLKLRLRERAEEEAIKVFARNLHDLLLAAPAGPRATMGLDPGLRTGVKVAVVDATGKLLTTGTIYPHAPKNQWEQSIATLASLCEKFNVELIAIGNGTASRETDKLAGELLERHPALKATKVMVSEAGASVYSASELAAKEFPDLDVSLRGAVSIARRLQDPLAELVKIDPKSIGVGQYQHDVAQTRLARTLDAVVEDCVNAVGVDVNTASPALLTRISGLNTALAANIVGYRDQHGAFRTRTELMKVPRLGEKAFEQAAGFLRIMNGDNPLDASAVHPEAYPVVERIIATTGKGMRDLIGDSQFLKSLKPANFTDGKFGEPTVKDILAELEKPGRDPRPEFKTASFREGVEDLKDLQVGMVLEGVVTNVTNFGAFVDIGVHQDGLVHISALADKFVKDPREVVKAGDLVKVKVMEVDIQRKRVGLSMRLSEETKKTKAPEGHASRTEAGRSRDRGPGSAGKGGKPQQQQRREPPTSAMAQAFAKLKK